MMEHIISCHGVWKRVVNTIVQHWMFKVVDLI